MGSGYLKKKKQSKMFQSQIANMQGELQTKLDNLEVTGVAGNGLVTITLNGSHEMKRISIKPECVDPEDIEGLELLIKAAHKDASDKVAAYEAELASAAGLPFMNL